MSHPTERIEHPYLPPHYCNNWNLVAHCDYTRSLRTFCLNRIRTHNPPAKPARWVADEEWHPDQRGQWHGKEYELQVPYSGSRELIMEILKYAPEVDVLKPEELRRAVRERLGKAAEKYLEGTGNRRSG